MTGPEYAAPRAVAGLVRDYFERHIAAAQAKGEQNLAPQPDAPTIEAIVEAAFWASLRREEGFFPRISLALLPPEQAGHPLTFERRLPLTPLPLSRLAPPLG